MHLNTSIQIPVSEILQYKTFAHTCIKKIYTLQKRVSNEDES